MPSHYLSQCSLIVNCTLRNKIQWNSNCILFHSRKYIWKCRLQNGIHFVPGRWINSLWPSDTIWWQISGSTLAQVMACCLMAPSHYLNQCWLIISEVQWHSHWGNFTRDASTINHYPFENYIYKISFKFPRGQWVKPNMVGVYQTCILNHGLSNIKQG